jgi:predicted nucleic acid-binding protein
MFILDTNVISELRKAGSGKADHNAVSWLSQQNAKNSYVSAITLMEIEFGILRIVQRDTSQGKLLRQWMDYHILPEFSERTIAVDSTIALRSAALHVPDPRPERDAFIAAFALVHRMVIVTRNVANFLPMGVTVIDPWNGSPPFAG